MKKVKRILSLLVALTMVACFTVPVSASELPFTDVTESYWAYDAIKFMYENGITDGISATEFGPERVLNRAQIVTFLHRFAGTPISFYEPGFTDIEPGSFYYDAVCWAAELGLTTGTTATTFDPTRAVTIQEVLIFLYRYGMHEECGNMSYVLPYPGRMSKRMNEYGYPYTIAEVAIDAVDWAVNCGILDDYLPSFDGTDLATRAVTSDYFYSFTKLVWVEGKALTNSEFNLSGGMEEIARIMTNSFVPTYVHEDLYPIALEYAFYNSRVIYLNCHGKDDGKVVYPSSTYVGGLSYNMIDIDKMCNVELAYISACYTGGQFAEALWKTGGAETVIGFTGPVTYIYDEDRDGFEAVELFDVNFWKYVSGHMSYEEALEQAEIDVIQSFIDPFGVDKYVIYH